VGLRSRMDIYAYDEKTGATKRLTSARVYDAEGSYSPDGKWIAFASLRSAYDHTLNDAEKKALEENPSNFADIFIMKADAPSRSVSRMCGATTAAFLHARRKRIVWRRFDASGLIADVWIMNIDGTDAKQITDSDR